MTSRRKPPPEWRPATQRGWVYAVCFDEPYPPWVAEDKHQVRHYIGWAFEVGSRLADHASGTQRTGPLMRAHIGAGGSFLLARVERGTRDRENQLKYSGYTRRCPICKARSAGIDVKDLGWIYVAHFEPAGGPGQEPLHKVAYTPSAEVRLDKYAAISPTARRLLALPPKKGGKWRLAAAERGTPGRVREIEEFGEKYGIDRICPDCKPGPAQSEEGPPAGRPARELAAVLDRAGSPAEFPAGNPLAGTVPAAGTRPALLAAPARRARREPAASPARGRR